jgi:hypothetical protein
MPRRATFVSPTDGVSTSIAVYLNSDWIKEVVQEFQAPSFRGEGPRQYELLLSPALTALCWRGVRWSSRCGLFWAHQSLTSVRHIPLFAALAGPLVACKTRLWNPVQAGASRKSMPAILLL